MIEAVSSTATVRFDRHTYQQPAAGSVADELLKLKQLFDAGAISQAEYEQLKVRLLN